MNAVAEITAPFSGTCRLHTSEPRWPTTRPPLDAAGGRHLLVAGPDLASTQSAIAWQAEATAASAKLVPVLADAPAVGASLAELLQDAPVSTRLLVAGDEALIARAVAAGLAGGLRPPDIRVHLTDPAGPRPVQCVHCRAITETTTPVDGICACSGCGVLLLVFPHFSRRIGAYLGFHAEAEELA